MEERGRKQTFIKTIHTQWKRFFDDTILFSFWTLILAWFEWHDTLILFASWAHESSAMHSAPILIPSSIVLPIYHSNKEIVLFHFVKVLFPQCHLWATLKKSSCPYFCYSSCLIFFFPETISKKGGKRDWATPIGCHLCVYITTPSLKSSIVCGMGFDHTLMGADVCHKNNIKWGKLHCPTTHASKTF